jgi:hypothetical protein
VFGRAFWNEELSIDQQEIDVILECLGVKAVAERCPWYSRCSQSDLGLSMISKKGIRAAWVGVWGRGIEMSFKNKKRCCFVSRGA